MWKGQSIYSICKLTSWTDSLFIQEHGDVISLSLFISIYSLKIITICVCVMIDVVYMLVHVPYSGENEERKSAEIVSVKSYWINSILKIIFYYKLFSFFTSSVLIHCRPSWFLCLIDQLSDSAKDTDQTRIHSDSGIR